jgi:hypothetical protein
MHTYFQGMRLRLLAALAGSAPFIAVGADTAFTYQGLLTASGQPAAGLHDFTFSLHATPADPEQVGNTLTNDAVEVDQGRFTTDLDFGIAPFDGQTLWLQIGVRPASSEDPFTSLTPRQRLAPTPYALRSTAADNAALAEIAATVPAGSLTAQQIAPSSITGDRLAGGHVVRSLNGLRDDLLLLAGNNVELDQGSGSILINGSFDWSLAGNSNTITGLHFVGTADDQPLEFKVNGNRALRLEPSSFAGIVNVIGGSHRNQVVPGISGATIAGGGAQYAEGGGDYPNVVQAQFGTIGGGYANIIGTNAAASIIGGGHLNAVDRTAFESVIGGGRENRIGMDAFRAVIGGGSLHQVMAGAYGTVINGGISNSLSAYFSTLGGGSRNAILVGSQYATIAGGGDNFISSNSFSGAIGGGGENRILHSSPRSTIAGGKLNQIGSNSPHSAIGGGLSNQIADNTEYAIIPGGRSNLVSAQLSLAAGNRAKAFHPGSFVWADTMDHDFASASPDEFAVRASGGVRFVSAVDGNGADVAGVLLASGDGSWSSLSDREAKTNFTPIPPREVLEKVLHLPIQTWSYKSQDNSVRHLGPTAQDFHAAFGLGNNDRRISTVDADGVALSAIQGLHELLQEKSRHIAELEARNAELVRRLEIIENRIAGSQ